MRVGFAGLGRMGAPMAKNLIAKGHEVTVWNRSRGPAGTFAEATGAPIAETPRAMADGADVVVTMLADDDASDSVHDGVEGLFSAAGAQTFVEMGTLSPGHVRGLSARAPAGVIVIDAPVSGSIAAAEAGELMIMAGCDADAADRLAPVLDAMGGRTIAMGHVGAGAVMKLVVNAIIHGLNQTVSEALTLAKGAGIEPNLAYDVIEASAAGAPMLSYRRAQYLDEAAQEVSFTVTLAAKDMTLAMALAQGLGVAMPQGALNLETLQRAMAQGYGNRDMAAILDFIRQETP